MIGAAVGGYSFMKAAVTARLVMHGGQVDV
jgi:hypothetical protein